MRSILLSAASLVALAAVFPPSSAEAAAKALVIGINKYPGITMNGKPSARDLKGAVADAGTMKETLAASLGLAEADIKVLTDEAATRDAILAAFKEWLIDGTKPGDTAYFYFAGHGAQVEDATGDEEDKFDEVLAPADTKGELGTSGTGLSGYITDDEIKGLVAEMSGREVIVIADACHSGTITRSALDARASEPSGPDGYMPVRTLTPYGPLTIANAALEDVSTRGLHRESSRLLVVEEEKGVPPDPAAPPPKVVTWTAVGSAQFAMEDMEKGGNQGLFTSRFKKGVSEFEADLDENGKVTGSELLAYLRKESSAYCAKFPCPTGATPTLDAYAGYDAAPLLAKPPKLVVPAYKSGPAAPKVDYVPPKKEEYVATPPPKVDYAPPKADYVPPKVEAAYPVGPAKVAYVPPPVAYAPPKVDYVPPKVEYVPPPTKEEYVAAPPPPGYAPPPPAYAPIVVAKDTIPKPIGPAYYGEVVVEVVKGPVYYVGDTITVKVTSAVPGRLIILDARDDGTTVQLFPNKFSATFGTSETIAAGETRLLPGSNESFAFTADKADKGTIIVLIVDPKVPIGHVVDKYVDFTPIPSVDEYAAAISHEINKAVGYPTGSEEALDTTAFPVPYGRGEYRYEIY